MSAVPTVYAVLADRPVDADISSLRFAIVGASPLPQAVRDRFESATGVPPDRGLRTHRGHLRQRPAASLTTPSPDPSASGCPTSR